MEIVLREPSRFFCEPDEAHFYGWLEGIGKIIEVRRGDPDGVEIAVDIPTDRMSFYELVGLLSRYGLDRACLRPLCHENPDPWFRDPKNYWFKAVYGSEVPAVSDESGRPVG